MKLIGCLQARPPERAEGDSNQVNTLAGKCKGERRKKRETDQHFPFEREDWVDKKLVVNLL